MQGWFVDVLSLSQGHFKCVFIKSQSLQLLRQIEVFFVGKCSLLSLLSLSQFYHIYLLGHLPVQGSHPLKIAVFFFHGDVLSFCIGHFEFIAVIYLISIKDKPNELQKISLNSPACHGNTCSIITCERCCIAW